LSKKTMKWFDSNIDSSYYKGKWDASGLTSDKPMFQLDGKKYTQQQFATYLKENFREGNKYPLEGIARELFADWTNETALELEKSKLLTKYPEYKALMDEYHDGILLYEVMSDKVWNKAMSDTSGLEAYY